MTGVLPFPYNDAAKVLAEAVTIAATQHTARQRLTALAVGGIAVMIVALWSD